LGQHDQDNQVHQLYRMGIVAAFSVLAFVGTAVVRVPIPASGGYFNLGDTFVMVAALLYGPLIGGLVGMIGPALADAIGFPQFILATAVVKGMEGMVVGLIAGGHKRQASGFGRIVLALLAGIGILVAGYYLFEAWLYPVLATWVPFFGVTDAKAALAELIPNGLQGGISAMIAFGIWRAFRRPGQADPD
jgi:uncharacterized membrane protein